MNNALEALQTIPPDLPRDEWHEVGRAAIAAGLSVNDLIEWSRPAANFKNENDVRAAFRAVSLDGGTGAGTLFFHARKYGFVASKQTRPPYPMPHQNKRHRSPQNRPQVQTLLLFGIGAYLRHLPRHTLTASEGSRTGCAYIRPVHRRWLSVGRM